MAIPFVLKKLLVRTRLARWLPRANRLAGGGAEYLHYYSDRVLAAPVEALCDPMTFPASEEPEVLDLNLPAPRFESPVALGRRPVGPAGVPAARGLSELAESIADTYRTRGGRAVDPRNEVLVTHGATGAFAAALDAFVNPGDRVALFDPGSPLFGAGVASRRARPRWIPTWDEDGRTRFLEAGLSAALRGAKVLALSDPINPTGGRFDSEDFERIAWWADRFDVLVYLDESFAAYRYSAPECSLATLAERRTVTAGSVSQKYGLRSLRVGWLTGPRHLVKACALTGSLSAPYVPTVCQQLAARALATGGDPFDSLCDRLRDRRRYTLDRLRGMGLEPTAAPGGYFTWVAVSPLGMTGRAFANMLLREHGVRVGPGDAFGPSGMECVRVSFAEEDGRLREGLSRLATFVAGLRGGPAVGAAKVELPADAGEPSFSRG